MQQPCPVCHSCDTPHTWTAGYDGKCGLCGRVLVDASALSHCIDSKVQGLRYELKTLARMSICTFAFDGQLARCQALMADLVALRDLQLEGELKRGHDDAGAGETAEQPVS